MPSLLRKLPTVAVLATLVVLIYAQDTSTVLFPAQSNGSGFDLSAKKIEPTSLPDVTQTSPYLLAQQIVPPNNYLAVSDILRPPIHHRSENFPYGLDYPNLAYPLVPQATENPVGLSSKHLIIVSFIGLLLLFAIIQNTIVAAKRKDALVDVLSSRRKRDLFTYTGAHSMTPEAEAVLNDDARVRCIQRTICLENKKLFRDLGAIGKVLAKYLTQGIKTSLDATSGWDRLVEDAGAAGLRDEDCNVLYRSCNFSVGNESHEAVEHAITNASKKVSSE